MSALIRNINLTPQDSSDKYSYSCSISTTGLQRKYWSGNFSYLVKCDMGMSPTGLVECLCSGLLDYTTYGDIAVPHAQYEMSQSDTVSNGVASVQSANYCRGDLLEIPFASILRKQFYRSGDVLSDMRTVVSVIADTVHVDVTDYLYYTFLFDYLVINCDRHWRNLAVLVGKDGAVPAPIFDNGLAFNEANLTCPRLDRSSLDFMPFCSEQAEAILSVFNVKPLRVRYSEFLQKADLNSYREFYPRFIVDSVISCLDSVLLSCRHPAIEVI